MNSENQAVFAKMRILKIKAGLCTECYLSYLSKG